MEKQWKQWQTLYSWASKSQQMVTTAMKLKVACSLEEKLTNLDSILKSRDITLPAKVHLVKAMAFPVVIYRCESWTIKKVECRRIDAFELWCWRRLLRFPWTARRSKQQILKKSILNIHWKDWCWSRSFNILATWCEELTHLKRPWCWERLKAGGKGDDRGWDSWMASPTWWTWVWSSSRSWWWTAKPGLLHSMGSQRVGDVWATELKWTDGFYRAPQRSYSIVVIHLFNKNLQNANYMHQGGSYEQNKSTCIWNPMLHGEAARTHVKN